MVQKLQKGRVGELTNVRHIPSGAIKEETAQKAIARCGQNARKKKR
jgi:hypothetical protein